MNKRVAAGGGLTPLPTVPIAALAVNTYPVASTAGEMFVGSVYKKVTVSNEVQATTGTNTASGVSGTVLAIYDPIGASVHSKPASATGYKVLVTTSPSATFLAVAPSYTAADRGKWAAFTAESATGSANPIRGSRASTITLTGYTVTQAATVPVRIEDQYGVEAGPNGRPVVIVSLNPQSVA